MKFLLASLFLLCGAAWGQNTLNGAPYSGSGATVPASCSGQGTLFFKTSATRAWYWCNGGSYTAFGTGSGSGTVTSIATTSPITGGTITGTGTIACSDCLRKTPGADQAITGAFALTLSDLGSGLRLGNSSNDTAGHLPLTFYGSGSSFNNGGEFSPSNGYAQFSMWNSTHGGIYILGVADGSDGAGGAVPAFSLDGVWNAAQSLPAGHAITEMIGNSPNSGTGVPEGNQIFGVNNDFGLNIFSVWPFNPSEDHGVGKVGINLRDSATIAGALELRSGNTAGWATIPLLVVRQGTTGQTGDLLELQNSTGTNLAKVDSSGLGTFANLIDSGLTANLPVLSNGSKQLVSSTNNITSVQLCGTTTTCAKTLQVSPIIVYGTVALSSGTPSTATLTALPFTSTSSYVCTATEQTSAVGNLLKVANASASSTVITGPATVTDVINYICVGS